MNERTEKNLPWNFKEGNPVTCYNMDKPWGHQEKWCVMIGVPEEKRMGWKA